MPRRQFRKRTAKKAPRRRIRRTHRRIANRVPNGAAPVAKKHIVKLKYADVMDFSVMTLATGVQQFRLNSLFDPDLTSAGHQPYGFDQLATLFAHYRVFKCSWHIQFAPSNDRLHITVCPTNGATITSSTSALGEQPLAVTKAMSFAGGPPCIFKGSTWLPRLTGASSVQYKTDDRYSAAVSTNPAEAMTLSILVYNPSSQTVTTSMSITLMFWSEFYDPITLAQS